MLLICLYGNFCQSFVIFIDFGLIFFKKYGKIKKDYFNIVIVLKFLRMFSLREVIEIKLIVIFFDFYKDVGYDFENQIFMEI